MSVRTVLPTDLVALVAFDGRVFPNEAVTRDHIGRENSLRPLEAAIEQWFSFATGRHTWITVRGATLRGLLAARKRGGRQAWEFDCLVDAADDDPSVLLSLLDQAARDAGRGGAEKLFLRLRSDSDVVKTVLRAGFAVLQTETLYRNDAPGPAPDAACVEGLRHRRRADLYRLFQLYSAVVPEEVRRLEAPTLREWVAAQERLGGPRRTTQLVLEAEGRALAWLRFAADGWGRFDVVVHPAAASLLDDLVAVAAARVAGKGPVFSLAPTYAEPLARALERRGFAAVGQYTVLVRRTMTPVKSPRLVPASTLMA